MPAVIDTHTKKQDTPTTRGPGEPLPRVPRRFRGEGLGRSGLGGLGGILAFLAMALAPLSLVWACSSPEVLDCAPGTWRREGGIYGCVYEGDSSRMCPEEAPHRWVFGDVVLCVTERAIPATFCDGIDGCFPISGSGGGGGSVVGEPATCSNTADCGGASLCESYWGIDRCYLPCAADVMTDGGTVQVADHDKCEAEIGPGSRCAERSTVGNYRCAIPCDIFDTSSCGDAFACDFESDYGNDTAFTECRQWAASALGTPCGANNTLCPAGYTCQWTNDDYRCTPLCDPTGQDLPPCPTEAPTCASFGRSDPSTGRPIGFCRIPNGS